ncbi:MAG: hypothetical protein ISR65_14115 [Bacteriovoracaceae bacterium]|nr:hypothetical protein [Bacteriovoracaceae bacterium]
MKKLLVTLSLSMLLIFQAYGQGCSQENFQTINELYTTVTKKHDAKKKSIINTETNIAKKLLAIGIPIGKLTPAERKASVIGMGVSFLIGGPLGLFAGFITKDVLSAFDREYKEFPVLSGRKVSGRAYYNNAGQRFVFEEARRDGEFNEWSLRVEKDKKGITYKLAYYQSAGEDAEFGDTIWNHVCSTKIFEAF